MTWGSGGCCRSSVGSRGKAPGRGLGGQCPQKLKVFSVCHHKKQHSGAQKSDICRSASFMFRPDIYLAILKITLKMSFWCSKNKILAKVCMIWQQQSQVLQKLGYFLKKIMWTNTCVYMYQSIFLYSSKIYSGTGTAYFSTYHSISNNQRKATLSKVRRILNRNSSQSMELPSLKKKKKEEISRGVRGHAPLENFWKSRLKCMQLEAFWRQIWRILAH